MDCSHGTFVKTRNGANQIKGGLVFITEVKDFLLHFFYMRFQLVYVFQALAEFDSLFRRYGSINGSLGFPNRSLALSVNKRWCVSLAKDNISGKFEERKPNFYTFNVLSYYQFVRL